MTRRSLLLRIVLGVFLTPVLVIAGVAGWLAYLNETNGTLRVNGVDRVYLLHVPPTYDRARPAPLVISLHGAGTWPAHQKNASGWNRLADSLGFIVVYPAGQLEGPRIWHVERGPGLARDIAFIGALIDTLAVAYNIDRARIYANGLSNGGGMSFVLSCAMPERIAAVGMASAAQTLEWNWCTDRHAVPVIDFHGTADPIVPYEGGLGTSAFAPTRFDPNARPFPRVIGFDSSWAARNQCEATPTDSTVAPGISRRTWARCANGADVVLYTVSGGGHQWPGGKQMAEWFSGPHMPAPDATRLMWEFFAAHPRPAP